MSSVRGVEQLMQVANARSLAIPKHRAYRSKFAKSESSRCFILSLLSPKRSCVMGGQAPQRGPRACNLATEGRNDNGVTVQSKEGTFFSSGFQFDSYPWSKFITKLTHQAADGIWLIGKWIVVPTLILIGLRDAILAVATGNELWIPAGLLVGTLFTGILKETLAALGIEFQHTVLPWHLVDLVFFFMIMRIVASKILPFGFRMFLHHFITGGLWQTIRFCVEWKRNKGAVFT